jgi:hypothetical protein
MILRGPAGDESLDGPHCSRGFERDIAESNTLYDCILADPNNGRWDDDTPERCAAKESVNFKKTGVGCKCDLFELLAFADPVEEHDRSWDLRSLEFMTFGESADLPHSTTVGKADDAKP